MRLIGNELTVPESLRIELRLKGSYLLLQVHPLLAFPLQLSFQFCNIVAARGVVGANYGLALGRDRDYRHRLRWHAAKSLVPALVNVHWQTDHDACNQKSTISVTISSHIEKPCPFRKTTGDSNTYFYRQFLKILQHSVEEIKVFKLSKILNRSRTCMWFFKIILTAFAILTAQPKINAHVTFERLPLNMKKKKKSFHVSSTSW